MANGNGNAIANAADHALVRTFTPLVVAALMALVGWLFSSVLNLEENIQQNNIHIQHLHMAEEEFGKTLSKMQDTLTDIRIQVGRFTAH